MMCVCTCMHSKETKELERAKIINGAKCKQFVNLDNGYVYTGFAI